LRRGSPASKGELATVALAATASLGGNVLSLSLNDENTFTSQSVQISVLVVSVISFALLIIAYFDRAAKKAAARAALLNIREFTSYATPSALRYYGDEITYMTSQARHHVGNMMASGDRNLGDEISYSIAELMDVVTGGGKEEDDEEAKEIER
jgi:hypothetical protein